MIKNNRNTILSIAGIAMLAVSLPLAVARAQTDPGSNDQQAGPGGRQNGPGVPPQAGPGGQLGGPGGQFGGPPRQGGPGGQFGGPGQQGGIAQRAGMGGGAAIAVDNSHVYVLRGNTIYKVAKTDLKVVGAGELPMPGPGAGRDRAGEGGLGGETTE